VTIIDSKCSWIVKKIKIYILCIGCLLFVVSCNQSSRDKEKEAFDTSLINKSSDLQLSGKYDELIHLNIEYLKKAGKINYQEGKALCYLNIAGVNVSAGNYEKALFFFKKAEKDLVNSKNEYHQSKFFNDYSLYYSHLKLYDKAIQYNNKAISCISDEKKSDLVRKLLPRLYINRGIYYAWKGWRGTSLKSFLKGNTLENSAYSNCMVAQYYLFTHQAHAAEPYISRADEKMMNQKTSDVESMWVYYTMGYYYNEVNELDEAEKALTKALEINIKTKRTYSSHISGVYKALSDLYKKKNDQNKAYYYLKQYMEEENKLDSERFATMNKATEDFIAEMQKDSGWHKSDLPLVIVLSIAVISFSGMYVQKMIKGLKQKKRNLKQETHELKNYVFNKKMEELMELAKKNDSSFLKKFREIHPEFISALLTINADLENSELAFCAMLMLGFSSREIAEYTFVQPKSVQQKKYRIRKRLHINGDEDIYVFFNNLRE
jgi:tetratricopeptide (TPR) repeat protein